MLNAELARFDEMEKQIRSEIDKSNSEPGTDEKDKSGNSLTSNSKTSESGSSKSS